MLYEVVINNITADNNNKKMDSIITQSRNSLILVLQLNYRILTQQQHTQKII